LKKITSMLILAILSSCTIASDGQITLPIDDKQRLIIDNLSLTTEDFFSSYMSPNVEQRRLAEMYLIGVIDSSEGITWCGYEVASPSAIQEQVYLGLKEVLAATPKRRAADSIKLKLEQLLPCKDSK
jgi:hypothetical protein